MYILIPGHVHTQQLNIKSAQLINFSRKNAIKTEPNAHLDVGVCEATRQYGYKRNFI